IRVRNVTGVQTCALPIFPACPVPLCGVGPCSIPTSSDSLREIAHVFLSRLRGTTAPWDELESLLVGVVASVPRASTIAFAEYRVRPRPRTGVGDRTDRSPVVPCAARRAPRRPANLVPRSRWCGSGASWYPGARSKGRSGVDERSPRESDSPDSPEDSG